MHRIDTAGAVANMFTEGSPQTGQRATKVGAAYMNDLQENVCQAIEMAGIPLVKGDGGQLAEALQILVSQAIGIHGTQIGEGKWFHLRPAETEFYKFPNGQNLLAADYPALAAALAGDPFLAADAADKANNPGKWRINGANIIMPDLRGEFLRIWAEERAVDTGRALGSSQGDALQNVTGSFGYVTPKTSNSGDWEADGPFRADGTTGGAISGATSGVKKVSFDLSRSARTATETRPRNAALYYLIRVK